MQSVKLFLLDMDGTFYIDDTLLPGAKEFLKQCQSHNIEYAFLTNNSSKGAKDYIKKLHNLGVDIKRRQLFTSADATLLYLQENNFSKNILLIGTDSLHNQFIAEGYNTNAQNPCAVVLGFDTTLNYEKLTALCNAVRSGMPYIATHPDLNCPVKGGYIPDIGATVAYVKAATGKEPNAVIGKPNAYIARAAAVKYNVQIKDICMVGDRLYTDIALGKSGCKTAFVLSGEGTLKEMESGGYNPTVVCDNLAALCKIMYGG